MAISDDLPGVSITIAVNGTPLQEHNPAEVDGEHLRTVTKYVEVTSGQLFAVSIKLLPAFKFKGGCIVFEIYADGDLMSKPMFIKYNSDRSKVAKGRPSGHDKVEKFRFADVQTVDNDSVERQSPTLKHLGSIVIKCAHKMAYQGTRHEYLNREEAPVFREKDLKGRSVSHNVKLTAPEKCERWNWWRTEPVLGENNPAATFVFYYRSLAALKSMFIIPRTPSPEPLQHRAAAPLSTAEIEELQKRLQSVEDSQETKKRVKREPDDEGQVSRKRASPSAGAVQLEIDNDGNFRETVVKTESGEERVVIELE